MDKIPMRQSLALKIILTLVLSLVALGVMSIVVTTVNIGDFSAKVLKDYKTEALENKKTELSNYVQLAYDVVKSYYDRSQDIEELKKDRYSELKQTVDAISSQISGFYADNKEFLDERQLKKQIMNLVAKIRFNGTNYLWINDTHPNMIMHPIKPGLDGKDLSDFKDQDGVYLFKEMAKVCKASGEGMVAYKWPKPGSNEAKLKISYVKLIPELGWIIGAGDWVEDITAQMKKEALEEVSVMRVGKTGYFWVNDMHPKMVMHPMKPALDGKDISGLKDTKGKNLFVEMVEVCKKNGRGFVEYYWAKPGKDGEFPKMSYVQLFKPWGWVIGMGEYIDDLDHAVLEQKNQIDKLAGKITTNSILYGVVFVVGLVVICFFIIRINLLSPLSGLVLYSRRVADGDLNAEVKKEYTGEIGLLQQNLIAMVQGLKEKISEAEVLSDQSKQEAAKAKEATIAADRAREQAELARSQGMLEAANMLESLVNSLSSASEELAAQVQQVAKGSQLQEESMGEAVESMERMHGTVDQVVTHADEAAKSSDKARQTATEGEKIMHQSVEAINKVHTMTEGLKDSMNHLGTRADAIGQVMTVITDIADQTNLLALNAAIEAARAGEAGRGFAVVADEVRKLAEKTMTATKEVGEAINAIQHGAQESVEEMDKAAQAVESATDLVNKSGDALKEIVDLIEQAFQRANTIATASSEQAQASDEINTAILDVNQISKETSQGMEQAALAISELAQLAQKLNSLISKLRDS